MTHPVLLNEILEIFLITYNRKSHLQKTFDQIFADKSPIKNFEITILDNKSTDGTSELIETYAARFKNIKHVRHNQNIGGVANSIRPFELVSKKYMWLLCDDDVYDWSNWGEVERAIGQDEDLICVARYTLPDATKDKIENQLLQLTFLPAGIYKTSNFTTTTMRNAYDSVYTLLPQCCFAISLVNAGKKIYVVEKAIVAQSPDLMVADTSYVRGNNKSDLTQRTRTMSWIVGYANVCSLIKDEALKHRTIRAGIDCKEVHGGFEDFSNCMVEWYVSQENWTQLLDVFLQLDLESQRVLLAKFLNLQGQLISNEKVLSDFMLNFGSEHANLLMPLCRVPFEKRIFSIGREEGQRIVWILGRKRTPAQLWSFVCRKTRTLKQKIVPAKAPHAA